MSKYYSSSIAFGAEQTKTEKVVVSPTKIGNVTTDAVSGALTVDEVPTLDSLNPVSSDGVARAVIQAGAELPTRGSTDTGKVLTVANSDGDLEWDEPADGIPDMTGKNGKVLGAVDNGGTMEAQWVNPPDSYPSVTGNAGKVLKVNAGATGVEWANESNVTVDQNYNASSTNPQSGTAVAGALETVKQVPAASSGDFDKILGVTDTSGTVGWVSKPASVSVDQNYNAYSENAQSGTAVAGAIATVNQVPTSTSADENKVLSVNAQGAPEWVTPSAGTQYSAGDGIGIDANNVISADVDGTTIGIDSTTKKIKSLQVIPTKTSDLQNDNGYITSSDIPAQVQSNWNESDTSAASFIQNKPDLSIYAQSANLATVATTGSYNSLSDKPSIPAAQVNSDWNSNSGVSQILNKPSLAAVATTGDYGDLLNKPSIPAAQVNADWNASSGVAEILNKPSLATVATTGAYSDLTGTPTIPSVDQSYNASSSNAQSGTAVAQAIAAIPAPSVDEVPAVTSSDDGKVLKATYSGGQGSYAWGTETGTTYTAGDAISITNNEISVDYDTNTLDAVGQIVTENVTQQSSSDLFLLPSSVAALLSQQDDTQVTVHIPANTLRFSGIDLASEPTLLFRFTLYATDSTSETNVSLFSTPLAWENYNYEYALIEEQDIVIDFPASVANQWTQSLSSAVAFSICLKKDSLPTWTEYPVEMFGNLSTNPITFTFVDASATKLAVKNPLPASAQADSGKVLKVNASGNAEWGTDGFTTTAGITDIQQVAALPANPVATVLYLIPET